MPRTSRTRCTGWLHLISPSRSKYYLVSVLYRVSVPILHETENEIVEEYTLPIDFIDELTPHEREGLYCWLNKDKIAQA